MLTTFIIFNYNKVVKHHLVTFFASLEEADVSLEHVGHFYIPNRHQSKMDTDDCQN